MLHSLKAVAYDSTPKLSWRSGIVSYELVCILKINNSRADLMSALNGLKA